MKNEGNIGLLLEAFVNKVSHPRGRALALLTKASVTVDQAILLNFALLNPGSTASSLATTMNLSLPSISQMIERLAKQGLVRRIEDPLDRRRKVIEVTAKTKTFLSKLKVVRSEEFVAGTAALSQETRRRLISVLTDALNELSARE